MISAIAGLLNHWLSVWPRLTSLRNELNQVKAAHKDCEDHRLRMEDSFTTPMPSDPMFLINALKALHEAGLKDITMADVIRIVRQRQVGGG